MSRVKLRLPGTFAYATDIRLRVSDINYGGHMDNNAVLSLVHEARVRFLESHGFTEMDVDGSASLWSTPLSSTNPKPSTARP